jgi:hypothetical protein
VTSELRLLQRSPRRAKCAPHPIDACRSQETRFGLRWGHGASDNLTKSRFRLMRRKTCIIASRVLSSKPSAARRLLVPWQRYHTPVYYSSGENISAAHKRFWPILANAGHCLRRCVALPWPRTLRPSMRKCYSTRSISWDAARTAITMSVWSVGIRCPRFRRRIARAAITVQRNSLSLLSLSEKFGYSLRDEITPWSTASLVSRHFSAARLRFLLDPTHLSQVRVRKTKR